MNFDERPFWMTEEQWQDFQRRRNGHRDEPPPSEHHPEPPPSQPDDPGPGFAEGPTEKPQEKPQDGPADDKEKGNGNGSAAHAPPGADLPADTLAVIRDSVAPEERARAFFNVMLALKAAGYTAAGAFALLNQYPNGLARAYRGRLEQKINTIFAEIKVKAGGGVASVPDTDEPVLAKAGELLDPWQPFVAPAFPLDILPGVLRDFVDVLSRAMDTDPGPLAMAVLTVCSSAIHQKTSVKMRRNHNWWVHCRLWTLLLGASSTMKSPIIKLVVQALLHIQSVRLAAYRKQKEKYDQDKKNTPRGQKCQTPEPAEPERQVFTDTTIEKLGELLARGERGIFGKLEEVAGWIGGMDQYKNASKGASADRAFWLQTWDGGHYVHDRIGRGSVFIKHLSVSILAGIQPKRLREIKGLDSDGLLQRFLPIIMETRDDDELDIDETKEYNAYEALIEDLFKLQPAHFVFTDGALDVIRPLLRDLKGLQRRHDAASNEALSAFLGKLRSYLGVFAIILHVTRHYQTNDIGRTHIAGFVAEDVDKLVRAFILPHAEEFYSRLGEGEAAKARDIASYILTSGKDKLRPYDLTGNVWSCRGATLTELNDRLSRLMTAGWVEPVGKDIRTCRCWRVNRAAIDVRFAERKQSEEARKQKVADQMGSPRKPQT
jgi:hypothetical protein